MIIQKFIREFVSDLLKKLVKHVKMHLKSYKKLMGKIVWVINKFMADLRVLKMGMKVPLASKSDHNVEFVCYCVRKLLNHILWANRWFKY